VPGPLWRAYNTPTGYLAGIKGRGKGNDMRGWTVGRQATGKGKIAGAGKGGWREGRYRLVLGVAPPPFSDFYVRFCVCTVAFYLSSCKLFYARSCVWQLCRINKECVCVCLLIRLLYTGIRHCTVYYTSYCYARWYSSIKSLNSCCYRLISN